MLKPNYRDLILILGLSIVSLIFINLPALNIYPLKYIPYILLLLILPGYAAMALFDPLFNHSSNGKKALLTIIVSLLISTLFSLLSTYTMVKVFNFGNLVTLTIILSLLAIIRRKKFSSRLKELTSEEEKPPEDKEKDEKLDKNIETVARETGKESKSETTDAIDFPKGRFYSLDLILVILLTILCAIFVLVPVLSKTVIRTILGLLLVLFFPGYALIAALFPKIDDLDSIERLALSFGLSIAITPLIGLVLNYTPYGIRLDPILISLTCVTVILSAVAFFRRRRLPADDRFMVDFSGFFKDIKGNFQGESKTEKILSVILIISIILAVATTVYIVVMPKEGESFTEFYILGPNGTASDYPTNLTSNQSGNVIIGVVNHENKNTSYKVLVTSNNTVLLDRTVNLQDGQKIEIPFNFTAGDPGERKIEFLLYKLPDTNNIYRSLHLWINITNI